MRIVIGLLCLLLAIVCGCSQREAASPSGLDAEARIQAWPKDWSGHIGQTVTLEGTAANVKLGAFLQGRDGEIWIDGLDSWPEGFYSGGDQGKRLRVIGMVIKKDDLPVFVQKPGELPREGIPVASEKDGRR